MDYKLYNLTITRCKNRIGLAKVIRSFHKEIPVPMAFKIVDNLETNPFVIETINEDPIRITKMLDDVAVYSYDEIFIEPDYSCIPPWERVEYKQAKAWYDTLPEEDRQKIDILINGNAPWA
jgi:hypothetical protein